MQNLKVKLWCNDPENPMYKALISTLLLKSNAYHKVSDSKDANLWCLVDEGDGIENVVEHYHATNPKPKVIFLARTFYTPPVSDWVFFKSPIHVNALFNWLNAQSFIDTSSIDTSNIDTSNIDNPSIDTLQVDVASGNSTTATQNELLGVERWRREPFKLQYWPNVTLYSDSPDIMAICTTLLRGWTTYDSLPQTSLPTEVLDRMLNDAHEEGNIDYRLDSSSNTDEAVTHDHGVTPNSAKNSSIHSNPLNPEKNNVVDGGSEDLTTKKNDDKGWGFFKSLLTRFIN